MSAARAWRRLIESMSVLGTVLIAVVMVVMDADVAGRALFNRPVDGVPEIVTMSVVAIVFFQLPAALAAGRFVRSDAFLGTLAVRSPRLLAALETAWNLAGALAFALLLCGAWPRVVQAWQLGDYFGNPGVFTFPRWPVGVVVLAGCAVTAIHFLLLARASLRGGAAPGRAPE